MREIGKMQPKIYAKLIIKVCKFYVITENWTVLTVVVFL